MNIYAVIILAALIIDFALNAVADYLNIKNLKKDVPSEFKDVFSADNYRKSQEYTKVNTRFSYVSTVFSLIITLVFWFAGGFEYLDTFVRGFSDSLILRGLLFIGILMIAQFILSLPFSLYDTFVIEERFGFNKTTAKTFISDTFKSVLLTVLLGGPLFALIIYILSNSGEYAWLYAWAAVTAFMLIVQFIAPTWIMPIFNKFKPLEDSDLRRRIFAFAEKVEFPLQNVFVMDGSKRSTKSNAFFTGFGKNKRIALFDTLMEKHTDDELVSVLAHEIGHYKKKHIMKNMAFSIVHTGVLFWLLSIFLHHAGLYEAFYMDSTPIYAGLVFFGMLYSPVEMILSVIMNIFSRKNEYEADSFAIKNTGEKKPMTDALKKLSKDNLSNLTPHDFYVFMNYSHPPVLKRIEAIKEHG